MRNQLSFRVTLIAVLTLGWQANPLTAQNPIKARQLEPLKMNAFNYPEAINSAGDVGGHSTSDGCNPMPVIWKAGNKPRQMRLPADDTWARISAINTQGTAVGESSSITDCPDDFDSEAQALWCADRSPVVWHAGGKPRILATPAKRGTLAVAEDINSLGEIVGSSYQRSTCAKKAVFWDAAGKPKILRGSRGPGSESEAVAIRSDGSGPYLAAGNIYSGGAASKPVVWTLSGKRKALKPLKGDNGGWVEDMNRLGKAVGASYFSDWGGIGATSPVKWTPKGKAKRLSRPEGAGDWCRATAINDADLVVGDCSGVPLIWEPNGIAHILPLPTWVDTDGCSPEDINDAGTITGTCTAWGGTYGVIWK
jgi:uncharacterized membrane protein